jgi:hypothetical protein
MCLRCLVTDSLPHREDFSHRRIHASQSRHALSSCGFDLLPNALSLACITCRLERCFQIKLLSVPFFPHRMFHDNRQPKPLIAARSWIAFSAFCNCIGWILSALHQLNATGYTVAFALGIAVAILCRKQLLPAGFPRSDIKKLCRRFRRPFPLAFAALTILATLGGVLYGPANPDGLTQRIPRVLHWLAEQRWHWIPNAPANFSTHACGFEWLMAPMFALLKTDRWVFVYNVISYLLLPGLVFSLFTRLGVNRRAAWYWMWLVPAGYCFAMQAGSIANDAAGAVFGLAAVVFALRAKESRRESDLWFSLLAAALLSATKTSNLVLGLPWLIAIWPSLNLLWRRPLPGIAIGVVAALTSLLPLMFLMHRHGAGWTGQDLERGAPLAAPWAGITGNGLNLLVENFLPPIFPMAGWWNEHAYHLLPQALLAQMERSFEPGAAHLAMLEIQFEGCAGLGFGLSWLLLISWIYKLRQRQGDRRASTAQWHLALVRWSPFVSLSIYMLEADVSGPARLIAPFYILLLPVFLTGPAQAVLVRRRWWRGLGIAVFLLCAIMLVVNPPRALWPAQTILAPLSAKQPQSSLLKRGARLYAANATRWDALAPIRDHLPSDAKNVGFISFVSGSSMETSLWRPFGQRRIWPLPRSTNQAELDAQRIHYVIIGTSPTMNNNTGDFQEWLDGWLRANGGVIIAKENVTTLATADPSPWYLIKIRPNDPP